MIYNVAWAWQVPLLETLTSTQQVLLSATLGDTTFLEKEGLGAPNRARESRRRRALFPVPLHFSYSLEPLRGPGADLHSPLTRVHRALLAAGGCRPSAGAAADSLVNKEQKAKIAAALGSFTFGSGFGQILSKLLRAGIGVHHAGLLPAIAASLSD